MPLMCYVHQGTYVNGPEDGCHHPSCLEHRARPMPNVRLTFPDVPGGASGSGRTADYNFRKGFDKGVNEYKKAKDEGLQPATSTVGGVERERQSVASQRRALKKLGKHMDTSELPVKQGVRE